MRRLNVKLLIGLVASAFVLVVGAYFLRRYHVNRNMDSLRLQAEASLEKQEYSTAIKRLDRYLRYRPKNAEGWQAMTDAVMEWIESEEAPSEGWMMAVRQGLGVLGRAKGVLLGLEEEEGVEAALGEHSSAERVIRELAELQLGVGLFAPAAENFKQLLDASDASSRFEDFDDLQYKYALALYRHGKEDESLDVLETLTGYDPIARTFDENRTTDVVEAFRLLGEVLGRMDRPQDARQAIEQVVNQSPDSAEARLARGRFYLSEANDLLPSQKSEREDLLAQAEADIRESIRLDPDAINAQIDLVLLLINQGGESFDEAEQILDGLVESTQEDDEEIRPFIGLAMLGQARVRTADDDAQRTAIQEATLADLEAGLARAPTNATLLRMKVETLVYLDRQTEARDVVVQLKRLGSASPHLDRLAEVQVLIAEQQWRPAQQLLDRLRGNFSRDEQLQIDVYRALCAENLGESDVALSLWRQINEQRPNNAQARLALVRLGAIRRDPNLLQNLEMARESMLEQIAEEGEDQAGAGITMALENIDRQLLQQFINDQMRLPEEQRDWAKVKETAGRIYKRMGELEQLVLTADIAGILGQKAAAENALNEAKEKFPDDPIVYRALAMSALRENDFEGAVAYADEGIQRLGASQSLIAAKLSALVRLDDPDESVQPRLKALISEAADLEDRAKRSVRFSVGMALIQRGAKDEGTRLWREIRDGDETDFGVRLALFMLAEQDRDVPAMDEIIDEVKENERFGPQSASYYLLEAAKRSTQVLNAVAAGEETPNDLIEEAREFVRKGKVDRPDWDRLERIEAQLELLAGNADAAVNRLKNTVKLNPGDVISARQLFQMQVARQDLAGASLTIKDLGPGPHPKRIGRLVAGVLELTGKVDDALIEAKRIVESPDAELEDQLWYAAMLTRNEKKSEAEAALQATIEKHPDSPGGYLVLVSFYVQEGRTSDASKLAAEGVAKLPDAEKSLFAAQALETLGQKDAAGKKYEQAVADNPDSMNVLGAYANYLFRNERKAELEPLLDQLIAAGPEQAGVNFSWARRVKAQELASSNIYRDFAEASNLLESEPKSSPEEAVKDGLMLATLLVRRQSEPSSWKRGLEIFRAAEAQRPLSSQERQVYAELLRKVKDYPAARRVYNQLLATLDSSSPQYQQYLAQYVDLLIEMGDYSEAEVRIRRLTGEQAVFAQIRLDVKQGRSSRIEAHIERLKPLIKDDRQLAALALFLEQLGLNRQAESMLKDYVQRQPMAAPALSEYLGRQGRLAEALQLLSDLTKQYGIHPQLAQTGYDVLSKNRRNLSEQDVLLVEGWVEALLAKDLTPKNQQTYKLQLAQLRELRDQQDDVIRLYQELLNVPDLGEFDRAIILNNLAFNYSLKTKDGAKAVEMVDQAMEILGPRATLLDTRGVSHLMAGDAQAAVADLREATFGNEDPQFHLHYAWALDAAGESDQAKAAFEKSESLKLNVNSLTAPEQQAYETLKANYGGPESASLSSAGDRRAA